jgi:hypothetical protein
MADSYGSLENTTGLITLDRNTAGSNISARWTWAMDGSTVNTFQSTVSGNTIAQVGFKPNPIFISDFTRAGQGIDYPMLFNASDAIPSITITGFGALTARPTEYQNFSRLFSWKDDFPRLVGKHNFKFGALVQRSRKNQDNPPTINGSFVFSSGSALHSGNALADALLGNFYTYNEGGLGSEGWFRFTQAEFYAADNWKIIPRLSVDLGARFALMQPQYAALNNAVVFSPRFFDPSRAPIVSSKDGKIKPGSGDPTVWRSVEAPFRRPRTSGIRASRTRFIRVCSADSLRRSLLTTRAHSGLASALQPVPGSEPQPTARRHGPEKQRCQRQRITALSRLRGHHAVPHER